MYAVAGMFSQRSRVAKVSISGRSPCAMRVKVDGLIALVLKHLDVGQARGVVDASVDVFPAGLTPQNTCGVGLVARVTAALAGHAMPGAGVDPAELLDRCIASLDVWPIAGDLQG
jgi:hypothetical protein